MKAGRISQVCLGFVPGLWGEHLYNMTQEEQIRWNEQHMLEYHSLVYTVE